MELQRRIKKRKKNERKIRKKGKYITEEMEKICWPVREVLFFV